MEARQKIDSMVNMLNRNTPTVVKKEIPESKPNSDHTGFYCFTCKKKVYPASFTLHNQKKNIMQSTCKTCKKPVARIAKFSKHTDTSSNK